MNEIAKDTFFYSDLIYLLKPLGGFLLKKDTEIEARIVERKNNSDDELSDFNKELQEIIFQISKTTGEKITDISELAKYPELVKEAITRLEAIDQIVSKTGQIKASCYVPSNDSETIAQLLANFKYDPSRTEEVLKKYEKLPERPDAPVRSLTPRKKL